MSPLSLAALIAVPAVGIFIACRCYYSAQKKTDPLLHAEWEERNRREREEFLARHRCSHPDSNNSVDCSTGSAAPF